MRIGIKLYFILTLTLLSVNPLFASQNSIADTWEKSPAHSKYIKAMEAGDLKTALEIKKSTIKDITKVVLKDYIADFKTKYQKKYLIKLSRDLSPELLDLIKNIYTKLSDKVPRNNEKMRNDFVKYLYRFMKSYNLEDGNTQKELNKLFSKTRGIQNTQVGNMLEQMAKTADTEANKSPEQKSKEYQEYMKSLDKKIEEGNKKIEEGNKKQEEGNKKIEEENKKQEERDKIIQKLKSLSLVPPLRGGMPT